MWVNKGEVLKGVFVVEECVLQSPVLFEGVKTMKTNLHSEIYFAGHQKDVAE